MNWDDLKVFIAVARKKKLSAAAVDLKMDITTISRRIKRLEKSLGQTLFERLRTGHVLTQNGQNLLVFSEQVEMNIDVIRNTNTTSPHSLRGTIRISVAEGFGTEVLSPILGKFSAQYPDVEIDLVSGSGFLSLSKREADIAIGLSPSKSKHINSTVLRNYSLHLYGHNEYLKSHPKIFAIDDLSQHTLIDYVDDLIYSEELRYFESVLPSQKVKIRTTSIMAQKKLVETGAGIAILPDFIMSPDFKKILPDEIHLERQFWFSSHKSTALLEKTKAFKAFAFSNLGDSA